MSDHIDLPNSPTLKDGPEAKEAAHLPYLKACSDLMMARTFGVRVERMTLDVADLESLGSALGWAVKKLEQLEAEAEHMRVELRCRG